MAVQVKVNVKEDYDPLDMNSYSLNKLPKRPLSKVGQFCQTWGLPIAAIIFVCCRTFLILQFSMIVNRSC